jgi:hypothetical protein
MFTVLGYLSKIEVAVVILGASLIVMLLVQMISVAVNLRGSCLRWGLRELFRRIDTNKLPTIAAQADSLAERVLTYYLTSDSIFSSSPWIGKFLPIRG